MIITIEAEKDLRKSTTFHYKTSQQNKNKGKFHSLGKDSFKNLNASIIIDSKKTKQLFHKINNKTRLFPLITFIKQHTEDLI